MTITTTLTSAPDLPDRTEQDQTVFDTRMADYWAYLKEDFEPELNDITDEINTTATAITTNASNAAESETNALNASDAALGAANFAGNWVDLTGALSIPASVYHAGKVWLLLDNLADVTASEPDGSNNDWFSLTVDDRYGTTTTTSAVDITLTATSDPVQNITMSSSDKFVILPDATGLLENSDVFTFFNEGNYRFGIKDSAGTFICSIAPKAYGRLSLINNSTASGTWKATDGADLLMARLKTVCNAESSSYMSSCKLTSTEVFIAWQSAIDGAILCAVLTDTGTTITVSNILEFDTIMVSYIPYIDCCRMTDTVAIVGYRGPDLDGFCAAITYDGTNTLTLTDTHEFKDSGVMSYIQVVPIYAHATSGKIGVFYQDTVSTSYLYAQVLNWTGTEITSNTAETAIRNAASTYISADLLSGAVDSASIAVSFVEGGILNLKYVSWDGSVLTPISGASSTGLTIQYSTYGNSSTVALNGNYFVVFGRNTNPSGVCSIKCSLCYWSGSALSVKRSFDIVYQYQDSSFLSLESGSSKLIDSETILLCFVNASYNTSYDTYIARIKAIGASASHECVLEIQDMIALGATGLYPNTDIFDSSGGLYFSRGTSGYIEAYKIDIGD